MIASRNKSGYAEFEIDTISLGYFEHSKTNACHDMNSIAVTYNPTGRDYNPNPELQGA